LAKEDEGEEENSGAYPANSTVVIKVHLGPAIVGENDEYGGESFHEIIKVVYW
jgi:hypothetical protein